MSFFFACSLLFLIPSNTTASATALLFVRPHMKTRKDPHHWFFVAWLLWAALSCFTCDHVEMSFFGYAFRMESLLTWICIGRLAWLYWDLENDLLWIALYGVLGMIFVTIASLDWHGDFQFFGDFKMTRLAISSMAALMSVILWSLHPAMSLIALPFLVWNGSRSALVSAVICILIQHTLTASRKAKKVMLYFGFVVGLILMFSWSGRTLHKVDLDHLGIGSRCQWIEQGQELLGKKPILGYGLDTLSCYLHPTAYGFSGINGIADRTHFLPMDIALQTGVVGLTLALLCLGGALGCTIKYPNKVNIVCFTAVLCWVLIGLVNPQGVPAHFLMLLCLFGIRNERD